MRRSAATILVAGVLVWPAAGAAQTPSPADAAVLEAWRISDCEVIAAAIAEVDPGMLRTKQTLSYKEYFTGDEERPLAQALGASLRHRLSETRCPGLPVPVAFEDSSRFEQPIWAADYSKALVKINLTRPASEPSTEEGRWRFLLLARDGRGWRVENTVLVRSFFYPTTIEDIGNPVSK